MGYVAIENINTMDESRSKIARNWRQMASQNTVYSNFDLCLSIKSVFDYHLPSVDEWGLRQENLSSEF